jgi:hypothetical protein
MIERWLGELQHQRNAKRRLSDRTRNKILVVLHGVFQRAGPRQPCGWRHDDAPAPQPGGAG